jgi:hypothetical protein
MNHLNPADLPYLVQQVANLPASADRDFAVAQLLLMMDAWEPVTALSLTGNIIDPHERWDTVCSIFRTMASHVHGTGTPDPTPLFNELDGLLPGPHAQFVYHNNFQTLAGENPSFGPAAAALAFALPPGAERTQALRGVATGWSKYDSQAALAWATSLPPADSAAIRDAIVPPPPTQNSTSSSSPTMNPSGFTPAVLESKGKSMPVLMGPRTITVAPSPDVQVEENAAAPPAATP